MDTFSQMSMDSEDSIPRNVYEEVVVDSTIQPCDAKEGNAVESVYSVVDMENRESAGPSEMEDETDDEEAETDSRSSTTPSPQATKQSEVYKDEEVKSASASFAGKPQSNIQDDQKTANLKLVLKKSPEYQGKGKNPPNNNIFLVALVSNASTTPNCSSAKYSVTGHESKVATESAIDKNTEAIEIEPPEEEDSNSDSKLEVIKSALDDNKPLKTYGRTSTISLGSLEEKKIDVDEELGETSSKDELDAELNRADADSKPNTPKIRRELQQLQKTVNESKILSEYMNDSTGKSRKARKVVPLKGSDNEGSPIMAIIRSRSRSCSKPRVYSPTESVEKLTRWPSEEKISKRQNMRSQNSEFVQKNMRFLNSIHTDDATDNSDGETSITDGKSSSHSNADSQQGAPKRELHPPPRHGWDIFCFKCHYGADLIPCSKCIRSYHVKCVKNASPSKNNTNWLCPECLAIENSAKTSARQKIISVDNLCQLLQFALKRMTQSKGFQHFFTDFNEDEYPDYSKYVVNPVTLEKLQENIEKKLYKNTEEFAVDSKWILHNCSIYFGNNSKITNFAKGIVKVCRQELTEIDTCHECYYNANTRKDWFIEVCSRPHILLWAKLKGFPYWPAKAMGIHGALVNVRFFGDHDRAYVPIKECFLYSESDPNPPTKQNKKGIKECIKEVDIHIKKITAKFGTFMYPAFRTIYDPSKELYQLEMMIPGITESISNAEKTLKPALTYKIVKTADNHLSIIKKDSEKVEDVTNTNAPVNVINSNTQNVIDKVRKQRLPSTDSSQSNNEVSSTCETSAENVANQECLEENKAPEKTVAPVKIQERVNVESAKKTYEVVSKVSDQEQTKVNSVILKRKSDNWNTVSATATKKQKVAEITEANTTLCSEPNTINVENSQTPQSSNQTIGATIKRKRSREDISKLQKPKLVGDKIPPLVLLTPPPLVIAPASSTLPVQTAMVPSKSALPIATSFNSAVTVTITQSPIVTSASINKSSPGDISSLVNSENREISIKRLPKKQAPSQVKVSTPSSLPSNLTNEKMVENVATISVRDDSGGRNDSELSKSSGSQGSNEANSVPKKVCELIPFKEIKAEKSDSGECNAELVEIRSKTATPEQPISAKSPSIANPDNGDVIFKPTAIKAEIMSEDEESTNISRSGENSSNEKSNDSDNTPRSLPHIQIAHQKSTTDNKIADKPIPAGKLETKKQRARKSFPSKVNFNPVAITASPSTSTVKRPIVPQPLLPQNNGMVYIPVDTRTSTIPTQSLTSATTTSLSNPKPLTYAIPSNLTLLSPGTGGNTMNSSVMSIPSTILTASVQMPIVYSTIPVSSVNGETGPSESNPIQISGSMQPNIPAVSEQHMLSGFVTPTLASAITDAIAKGPPKLAPRPSGPLRSEGNFIFPSEAGPVSKILMENAHKMTDFFRSVIEDTLNDMAKNGNLEAKIRLLELESEKLKYSHAKEMAELKHNTDLMLCEMRKSLENEKNRLVAETRKQCELERIRTIEEVKTKQWCAACGKEAQFYCCWNTSYCDYPCQQKHWARHMNTCAQKDNADANAQRVGVKISPYNVKAKAKDKMPNTFVRGHFPAGPRNTVPPIKRLIPITTPPASRYTIINSSEGNWGLVPTQQQYPRAFPTSGLIMSDGSSKAMPTVPAQCSLNMIRPPKM